MYFTKRILALVLAVIFSFGAVSVTAFVGLLPAAAEGESTLGATQGCGSGYYLGKFNDLPACVRDRDREIHICKNNFPDGVLRFYLSKNFDKDSNGLLSLSEINYANKIDCNSQGLESLKGIEFLRYLFELYCDDNKLTTLDVSGCKSLIKLHCSNNKLTTLKIGGSALSELLCNNNQLTTLDASKNDRLVVLNCENNKLEVLNISGCSKLNKLFCNYNRLTELDTSGNVELIELYCEANKLVKLDLSNSPKLTYLSCRTNQLIILDLSNNARLTYLDCGINNLTSLDVSKSVELPVIRCHSNKLTSLDVSKNTALIELQCSVNKLTALDLSNNAKLSDLECGNNLLETLDVSRNAALTILECGSNRLTMLNVSGNAELSGLYCSGNFLKTLDVSKNSKLKGLNCSDNELTTIDVSMNSELTALSCSENPLTGIDVRKNKKLSNLYCYRSGLTTLNIIANTNLTKLECRANHFTTLDISENSKLKSQYTLYNKQYVYVDMPDAESFDMHLLIPEESLSKVRVDSKVGEYDPKTGLIVFSYGQKYYDYFSYYYDMGGKNEEMEVVVCTKHYYSYVSKWSDIPANISPKWYGMHEYVCRNCYDVKKTESCYGGGANCLNRAVCKACDRAYGELDPETHAGIAVWEQTESKHTQKMKCCGIVTVDEGEHIFENGICRICEYPCAHRGGMATCTERAVCEICGETYGEFNYIHTGKEVWEQTETTHINKWSCCGHGAITPTEHTFKKGICITCKYVCKHKDNNGNHICDICEETISTHAGGTATCKDKAICEICGEAYGELDANNHTGKEVWNQTETKHTKKWNCCGRVTVTKSDHEFDDGICTVCEYRCVHIDRNADHKCDICGNTASDHIDKNNNHVCDICYKSVSDHSDENRDHKCDICGETISAHTGGSATCTKKAVCEVCHKKYGELAAHSYIEAATAEHLKSAATCTSKAVYYKSCSECGVNGTETFEYGELDTNNHTGEEVWERTETKHTKSRSCCGAVTVPESDHEFNNGLCTVCAYFCAHKDENSDHHCDVCIVTVSAHTDVNNDHLCDLCGETISNHTGGTATCKDKAICELCGESYGDLDPENHVGGTHLEHEKAATCTEKGYTGDTYCNGCSERIADGSEIPTTPHNPGKDWVNEGGKKVKKCTECGAVVDTLKRLPGDVDGDGEITVIDCLYLKRYILGTYSGEIVLENADVDGNGRIDAMDYLYLKRGYLGTFDLSKFA